MGYLKGNDAIRCVGDGNDGADIRVIAIRAPDAGRKPGEIVTTHCIDGAIEREEVSNE